MRTQIFFVFILFLSVAGYAQEVQVSIDETGKLMYIDAKLEQRLHMFPAYSNFCEARLFQASDTTFVLEISYQPQVKLLKVRLPLSIQEANKFRREVTERINQQAPQVLIDRGGRTKLLVGSLALSTAYYGWAVPVLLVVADGKSALALYMLTSGAGFFVPLSLTKDVAVTDASATLSLYGGTRGIAHGIFFGDLLFGKGCTTRGKIASGMIGSLTEAISGFALASKSHMSPGTAEVIGVGGDFGLGLGIGYADVTGFFRDGKRRSAAGSILLGSGAGLFAGKLLADDQVYTRGDACVLRAAGILGAYLPLAAVDIARAESEKAYVSAAMIGSVIGLGSGHYLVSDKDFTTGQGTLITLSEFAGGLIGLGLAYLVSSEGDNSSLYLTSSSLGATGGFWLMYQSCSKTAQTLPRGSLWNINFAPQGLVAWTMGRRLSVPLQSPLQIARISVRF